MYQLVDNLKRFGLQKKDTLIDLLIQIDKNEQIIEEEQLFVFFDLTDKICKDFKRTDQNSSSELEQFIISRILQLRLSFDTKYLDLAIKLEENSYNDELASRFKQNKTQILLNMYDKKIINNKNYLEKIYFQFKALDVINAKIEKLQDEREYFLAQLENAVATQKITEKLNKNGEELQQYQDMIIQRISTVQQSYNKYFKQKEMTMQQVADQIEAKFLYQPKLSLLKYKRVQDSFSTTKTQSQSYEQTRTSQLNASNPSVTTNEEGSKIQEYIQDQIESSSLLSDNNDKLNNSANQKENQNNLDASGLMTSQDQTAKQQVPDLTDQQMQQISLLGSQLTNRIHGSSMTQSERDKKVRLNNNLFNFAPSNTRAFIETAKHDDDEFVKSQLLQSHIFLAQVSQISASPNTAIKSPPSYKRQRQTLSKSTGLDKSAGDQDIQFGLQLVDYQLGDTITDIKNKLTKNKTEFVEQVAQLEQEYLFKNVNYSDMPELNFTILEMPDQQTLSKSLGQKPQKQSNQISSITKTVNEQNAMLSSKLQFIDDLETVGLKTMKRIQNGDNNQLFNKIILERWDLIDVNYLIQ